MKTAHSQATQGFS